MRRAAKIDDNQREIVDALEKIGCSVTSLAAVGKGCPDIIVGYLGSNYLLEIKDGSKPPSKRGLTEDQEKWHLHWEGQVAVVKNVEEAIAAVGIGTFNRQQMGLDPVLCSNPYAGKGMAKTGP